MNIGRDEGLVNCLPQNSGVLCDTIRVCEYFVQCSAQLVIHAAIKHLYPKLHRFSWSRKDGARAEGGVRDIRRDEHTGEVLGVEEGAADVETVLAQPDEWNGEVVRDGERGRRLEDEDEAARGEMGVAEAVEGGERGPAGAVRLGGAHEELDVVPRREELLAGEGRGAARGRVGVLHR